MTAVTRSTLRTRARARCDMESSTFVTDTQVNQFLNDSVKELWDLIIQKFGSDYSVSSSSPTITSGVAALPADFYKLMGIDMTISGTVRNLRKFEFSERNAYKNSAAWFGSDVPRYRLEGSNVRLYPAPADGTTCTIWYIPSASELSADGDSVNYPSGWEEYIVVDCAIKMRVKEESPIDELVMAKAEQRKRIEEAAENRDAGTPERISDVCAEDYLEPY